MLLPDKSGIRCDFCAATFKEQFSYFSLEAKRVTVVGLSAHTSKHPFDKDMCLGCYEVMLAKCSAAIAAPRRGTIKCDLCPKFHSGQFTYFTLVFTKADVDVKREKPTETEERFMDFNIGPCCMPEIEDRVKKTVDMVKREGNWT